MLIDTFTHSPCLLWVHVINRAWCGILLVATSPCQPWSFHILLYGSVELVNTNILRLFLWMNSRCYCSFYKEKASGSYHCFSAGKRERNYFKINFSKYFSKYLCNKKDNGGLFLNSDPLALNHTFQIVGTCLEVWNNFHFFLQSNCNCWQKKSICHVSCHFFLTSNPLLSSLYWTTSMKPPASVSSR